MVSQIIDASSVIGPAADTTGIEELTAGDYAKTVTERLPRDFVRMYHPDDTSSIVQLPPLGKNGKGRGDRQRKILHYITNKLVRGKQWWFASPPAGWQPKTARYACFLEGCGRNREPNMFSLFQVYRHFLGKHPDESPMYEGVLKAIQQKLAQEIPPELAEQLGLAAGTTSLNDAQFDKVMMGANLIAPDQLTEMLAPDAAEELKGKPSVQAYLVCADCDYTTEGKTKHEFALAGHRRAKHAREAVPA